MMINRRRVMGGSLPYDAEIEYLESTGTQYIDTLYTYPFGVDITFKYTQLTNNTVLCGMRNKGDCDSGGFILVNYSNKFLFSVGAGWVLNREFANADLDIHRLQYNKYNSFAIYDGVSIVLDKYTYKADDLASFCLFAEHGRNGLYGQFIVRLYSSSRIYNCKLYDNNNTIVRDFIPVRKGNVGYMYDKVSGKLFGNAGTGAFILGPDR